MASLSTPLAGVMIVFCTLSRTAIARFCANATQLSMEIGISSHKPSANIVGIGTVTTGLDTLSHHFYHLAIEASSGAVFTFT